MGHPRLPPWLSIGVAMIVAATLAGCSSTAATSSPTSSSPTSMASAAAPTPAPTPTSAPTARKKIVFIWPAANAFTVPLSCGARDEAKKLGYDFQQTGPDTEDAAAQSNYFNSVTGQHPAGVLAEPSDAVALRTAEAAMKAAGIKIVEVDTSLQDTTIAISHVSSDNSAMGVQVAQEMAKRLGEKGRILIMSLPPGYSTLDARVKAFSNEITTNHPGIQLVGPLYGNTLSQDTLNVTSTLAKYPDLAGIFFPDLTDGQGAAAALQESGKTGQLVVGAVDASSAMVDLMMSGAVSFIVSQNPYQMGVLGVDQLDNAFNGRPVQANIVTPAGLLTVANVTDPSMAQYLYQTGC